MLRAGCVPFCEGPTVLEVFNTLLKHLSLSVDLELGSGSEAEASAGQAPCAKEQDEKIVQNAIIQTIGESAGTLWGGGQTPRSGQRAVQSSYALVCPHNSPAGKASLRGSSWSPSIQ